MPQQSILAGAHIVNGLVPAADRFASSGVTDRISMASAVNNTVARTPGQIHFFQLHMGTPHPLHQDAHALCKRGNAKTN